MGLRYLATFQFFGRTNGMNKNQLKPDLVVTGPLFPEPVRIITTIPMGDSVKLIGKGLGTNKVIEPDWSPFGAEFGDAEVGHAPLVSQASGNPNSWNLSLRWPPGYLTHSICVTTELHPLPYESPPRLPTAVPYAKNPLPRGRALYVPTIYLLAIPICVSNN